MRELWRYLKNALSVRAGTAIRGAREYSFAELLECAEKRARGIPAGRTVYFAEGATRAEQAVSVLAGLAAGKTVIPLTDSYGEAWKRDILAFAEHREADPDVAFVVFTSGSTGRPKGVMLTDENIISNLEAIGGYFSVGSEDTLCIARPLVHIAVLVGEFLFALCRGASVIFYEESFQPRRLAGFLLEKGATVFGATPTVYRLLCAAGKRIPLRAGVISGERMPEDLPALLRPVFPSTEFYHVYGLSECSPRVAALLPGEFYARPVSIGRPIARTELEIENGELLVRSPGVMKGYWGNEALTAEKIRGGWLRTGDLAREDAGYYYILGRKDDMIIRGGVNIYPAEIENAARKIASVGDCVVFGVPADTGEEIVLAYTGRVEPDVLRGMLAALLPPHLLPSRIERRECLERTPSGKIRRI